MSPPREEPRAHGSRGPLEIGLLTDQDQPSSLAHRQADELVDAIRAVLCLLDSGEIPLDEAAATLHVLAGRLAVIGLTGRLVAA